MSEDAEDLSAYPEFLSLWEKVNAYTMTSRERAFALWQALNTLIDQNCAGSFAECGVWRGGSAMLIALTLLSRGIADREIILSDTFTGVTRTPCTKQ